MPIIGTAFEEIAIDLVVPLVISDRKHHWILTMIDFATRYPIAIPKTSIETVDLCGGGTGEYLRWSRDQILSTKYVRGAEHYRDFQRS